VKEKTIVNHLSETVRALSNRNYRIYFFCMLVSFTGTWMQNVAQVWLVYRLTDSALLLGVFGFLSQLPVFLLTSVGGVIADRYSRRRIIIITQTLAMIQALALAWLTLSGQVTVAWVISLALLLGLANAFELPARQSFVSGLVDKKDRINAIALNSLIMSSARIIGPALAGLLVVWLGEGLCFLINGLGYITIIGFFAIRVRHPADDDSDQSALCDLKEGLDFLRSNRPARVLLLLLALVSFFGMPYIVLMPIFADRVLGGGTQALGLMMSAAGVGALVGDLSLVVRRNAKGLGRGIAIYVITLGALLVLFSISRNLILSTVLLIPIGFVVMLQISVSSTLLQAMVDDQLRGRVMSFYSMSLMGTVPFGNLCAGAIAARIGAPATVAIGGMICLVCTLAFLKQLSVLNSEPRPYTRGAGQH
jgi:MFS family permease